MEDKDLQLRSEEVHDILTRVPSWMIRWGNAVVMLVLIFVVFLSWIIQYPDIVTGKIVITTAVPPEKIMANTTGRIETILVRDKSDVTKNMPLAIIANNANYKDVFMLKQALDDFAGKSNGNFDFSKFKNAQLGDVESAFSIFYKDYTSNELNTNLRPYEIENNAQHSENLQIKERIALLTQQKSINENELDLQKSVLGRAETLYKKGVIAKQELEQKNLDYLQIQKNYKNTLNQISELNSALIDNLRTDKNTQITGTKERVNLERNMLQSFYQLRKVIIDWELKYVLKSSFPGKVSFLQVWIENQAVTSGKQVFAIIPSISNGFIGKLKVSALNSGKIKAGQQVNIRLYNFPDREYGMLKGKIVNVALTPDNEGNLLLDVGFPAKLVTSYHRAIPFRQEMVGSAEIITENLRLIERLLYQFRDLFSRKPVA